MQIPPVFLNLKDSVEKACDLIGKAGSKGAAIVVFPETWVPGYPVWLYNSPKSALWNYEPSKDLYSVLFDNSLIIGSPEFERLRTSAAKNKINVIIGCNERFGMTIYNSIFYFSDDGVKYSVHRKLCPTYTEKLIWGEGIGSVLKTLGTLRGEIGGLVCREHWMPLARAAMHEKETYFHAALWPTARDIHQIASRHYAFEGGIYVAAVGTVLTKADVVEGWESLKLGRLNEALADLPGDKPLQFGGSSLVGPDGEFVTSPLYDDKAVVYADIDLKRIKEESMTPDIRGHYSRPDIFEFKINKSRERQINSDSED